MKCGAPGGIRTHGPKIRNLVLYPAELRAPGPLLTDWERAWQRRQRSNAGAMAQCRGNGKVSRSIGLVGRDDRDQQRGDGDPLLDQVARLVGGGLAVDRFVVPFAIMHRPGLIGEPIAYPA